ncbi:MAG: MEKHLA domain-containing protein [Methylococcales bacterium]
MTNFAEPSSDNCFLDHHIRILRESLSHWSGRDLVDSAMSNREAAEYLYRAPFAVLSHEEGADPRFTYANRAAQQLFAMNWSEMIGMHSRFSAQPENQEDRNRLLQEVSKRGYVDRYQGIRISKQGRRFLISDTMIWSLIGPDAQLCGQAAKFGHTEYLDE